MKNWYEGKTGNHQGLIIEEGTGKNIAVAYDKADAALIAAAPELLEALEAAEYLLSGIYDRSGSDSVFECLDEVRRAITKAKGGLNETTT